MLEKQRMLPSSTRLVASGWADLENGVAHLVLGYRHTVGLAAPVWVRERVVAFVSDKSDDELDDLADRLIAEVNR